MEPKSDIQSVLDQQYDLAALYVWNKFKKYYPNLTEEEAKQIAKSVVINSKRFEGNPTREMQKGAYDGDIRYLLEYVNNIKKNNFKEGEERSVYIPIKTTKKNYHEKIIASVIATFLAICTIITINNTKNRKDTNEQTNEYLNKILAMQNDENYRTYTNIVMQNATYDTKTNEVVIDENTDVRVAQDIANICNKNPELIDICLYNAYTNYENDKLYHMDNIIKYLKQMLDKEKSSYKKIIRCETFLDYLLVIDALNTEKHYYEQVNTINVYHDLKITGNEKPLELFGEYNTKFLNITLQSYEARGSLINKENVENLKEMYEQINAEGVSR